MSIRDELMRKYGGRKGGQSGQYGGSVAGATSPAAADQGRSGPSPVREDAAPRNSYSVHGATKRKEARKTYGSDTSIESVRRLQDRVAATVRAQAVSGMEKYWAFKRQQEQDNAKRHVMPGVNRESFLDTSHQEPRDTWERDWVNEFYLRYSEDPEKANAFAKEINDLLDAQQMERASARAKEWAMDHPFGAAALQLISSPLGLVDAADKGLEYLNKGMVSRDSGITPMNVSRVLGGVLHEGLNEGGTLPEGIPIVGGKGWGDLYGLGSSALQSLALGNTLGSAGTLAVYFGQSASAGIEEIKARGGTDAQAMLYGLASGAAEALAEKLPLDNLLKGGDAVHYTLKSWLFNALKQAGFEGTEEVVTSLANEMADRWIMGDRSNFALRVQELMSKEGMSEEDAQKKAWLEYAEDAAFDFFGGAASGGASMMVQTALPTAMANRETRQAYTPEMDAQLLELAMETEEGSLPYAMAQKYKGKGKRLTGGQINQLAGAYEEYTDQQEADALTEDASSRLEALDAENDTAARAIAKTIVGQELTRAEKKALQNSAEAKKVLQDMRSEQELPPAPDTPDAGSPWKTGTPMARYYEQNRDPLAAKLEQAEPSGISEQLAADNATDNAAAVLDNTANAAETAAEPVAKPVEAAVENVEKPDAETADSAPAVEESAENAQSTRTVEEVAEGFGNQAGAVRKLYEDGQDVDAFEQGVRAAWELGNSGIPMERAVSSQRTQGITESQRRQAYLLGQGAARLAAQSKATANAKAATGGTVRRKGAVKGQGVSIQDLSRTFNDPQKSAYKLLNFCAEVTGVDVVLYKGTQEQETGRFAHGENTIYIDITAGTNGWDATDLGAYTMMRTFSHEFVHFVEKWNPTAYNDLREAVFAEMEKNGSDPEALVEIAMQEQGITFDQASREVVAESLTDILPESQFVQTLASKHKSLFDKLRERLEAFVAELKAHWKKLTGNNSREAVALKRQVGDALEYAEEIVQMFSRAAGEAVEAYQATVAKKPGKVHTEGITGKLSELQRASIRALEAVAEALDLQIHLYESTADENGIRHAPNGYYDTTTGDIYLDIHAGLDGKGTMLFTAAHELVHFVKQWSPEKFQALADFLVERYGEKGISVEELVERQQAKAQRMGRELSYEAAFEEMVADSMESMLADGDIVQRLAELKQTDKGLWQKLKERFAELVQKLKAAYKGLKPDSAEGKYVAEMLDAAEKLKELFTEGLTDAARNHHPAQEADPDGWDDSMIEFSTRESTGLDDIEKRYKEQTDYLFLHENQDTVFLDNMVVKEELRNRGIGTKILEDVIAYADASGKTIALTPTTEFGTKKRLTAWYKRFGFVENKGKNTDFRLRDTMYRLPRPADEDVRISMDSEGRDAEYLKAVEREDMRTAQRMVDEAAEAAGYAPVVRWHQTSKEFTKFNTDNPKAGLNDSETPNGIFFKTNDHDIGLDGKKQMPLYLKLQNPLRFADRKEANAWYRENVHGYGDLHQDYDDAIRPLSERMDELNDKIFDTDDDEEVAALEAQEDAVLEEMKSVEDNFRGKLRRLLDDYFLTGKSGYDGIELEYDGHRWVNGKRENVHTFIAFKPNQAKSAKAVTYDDDGNVIPLSKRFDDEEQDIRFSDRDPAEAKLNRALQKENAAQAEEIQYLRELVRLQGKVTNGTKFTRSSVRTLAKQLMKDAGAKGNYLELGEKLNGIYESIAAQDDPLGMSWGDIDGRIDEAARWLLDHIEVKPDRGEYANDILRDLRARRISLNEGQMAEVKSRYGSYNDFRRAMFGSFTLSRDGTPLDMLWQELASQYPDTFDADIGDADMALELADVVARLREIDVAAMEFEMQRDSLQEELRQKVYDGYWRVSTLQTVADQWQKKVDDLKRQHQDTMERLDKARKERDAANADRIASVKKVREQKNEAVKKVRQQYQESKKKSQESRNKTAMRHKIQRVVKELNDLLLKPDKKHHVPEGLRKAVAEALEMVNLDPADTEARVARYDELIAKETDQSKKDAYEITRQNILDRAGNVRKRLDALRAAYEEIKNAADPEIANAYDANISECLLELSGTIGDTSIQDMSMEQLSDVYDMYTMVLNTIRDANKAFNEAISEGIREMADNADREITSNGKRSRLGVKLVEQIRKFGINNLKPTYFFHYLGSRTFRQLYQGLLDGQGQFARNMDEARSFRQEQAKKYGAKSWDREKTWIFKATSGDKFSLNLEQIMSLYAYSKRDQSREHIRRGGIVIDSETEIQEVVEVGGVFKVKLKGKSQDATAYNIDDVTLDEIIGKLTAKQRAFVDAMQDYLSDTMGAKGNEVSMKLYGIKLFKEKHYFPLKSAKEYSTRAKEQAEQSARLKNAGFTKATKPHASNPIMLTGFFDVWADHVQDMSSYHAMTLPIEDLYRVYNYSRNGDGAKGAKSVVAAIENAFGKQATGYMDQLLKDMNGGQIMDSAGEFLDQMTSRFKKGAVFMSASVMIQQSSSVARALSEIDAKYLSPLSYVESLTVIPRQLLGKVNQNLSRSHDAMWAELKRYAPVAVIKEMGSFDMNMGKSGRDYLNAEEYGSFKEKLHGFFKDGSYRDEVLSRAPALADELAWCDIWRAVKREQHEKHPKLKISSEEFLKLCGQRFTEIIDKTQVYDSVLSRSANMRSKNGTMKMATNFMAEPTTAANMLAAAVLEGKRGNKKKARRIAGAVMVGNIINAALAAIIYAARDDDEDKEYWEKYLGHLSGELVDGLNPLTYIPVAQDIVSVFQGWDVERADMAIVSDLYNAWNKLFSDKATTWEKTRDMVGATTQIFGIPLKNALKDAEALWRVMTDAFDGQESTAAGIGYAIRAELPEWIGGGAKTNGDQLYESILNGDKAHEERVRERFKDKEGNIDEGKVRSALRKAIRENDSRIHEAAVYLNEGQLLEYYSIVEEITGEGHFHKDDVVSAVQSEANSLLEDTGKEEAAVRHKSYFKAEHFVIAAADGDSQMMNTIKADLVLTAQDNGKTEREAESAAVSSIRGAVKEAFVETGALNEAQVKKSLMGWCDATEKEAADTVKEWTFEKQNGYPLSELEGVFVSGEITADKAEGFLVSHGGYARTEAESKVLQWQCEKDTGIRYDDVQELYVDGKLTADRAKELRVEYGESSIEDARKTVLQWTCEKDNGVKYSDIDVAYLSGDITERTAIDWLVKYGEKDRDKAGLTVQAYRWRDQHTEYKDLSDTAIDRYIDHCEGAGISIPDFYEANKKASEIKEAGGTVKENVVRYIRSLPLSKRQKWAMWYAVKTTSWKDNVSF